MIYGVRNDLPSQFITSDASTGPLAIDQYGRILLSDSTSLPIGNVNNNEYIKNYVASLFANLKIFYEYVFDSIAYSTNTLIKTWWELTIGTNQTVTSSIGKGITFN